MACPPIAARRASRPCRPPFRAGRAGRAGSAPGRAQRAWKARESPRFSPWGETTDMETWDQDLTAVCESFQLDLSCLVDGELDQEAAHRAMLHLESCGDCKSFFDET